MPLVRVIDVYDLGDRWVAFGIIAGNRYEIDVPLTEVAGKADTDQRTAIAALIAAQDARVRPAPVPYPSVTTVLGDVTV